MARKASAMARDHLLVIDQGTTSTRVMIYDANLRVVGQSQIEVLPSYPHPGWVEHDAERILSSVGSQTTSALLAAGVRAERIAALGITNQRETTVVWERGTGKAIGPALVWQDRRTADRCESLRAHERMISQRTGLVLDPYFSATKIAWLLDETPGARARAERGELAAGTVDSFLIARMTAGRRHVTDVTNASRTSLLDLRTLAWDRELCDLFGVPGGILPEILPSHGEFGRTLGLDFLPDGLPIAGVAGDQQASLVGQGCVAAGLAKCTYGTGAFFLAHTGERMVASTRGLITTLAASVSPGPPQYALEGSVFVAGAAVQWVRDGLGVVGEAAEIGPLAESADPESELIFVPALTGLGAPQWSPHARGAIFGITRATNRADLARAVLEGVAFQVADLVDAMCAQMNQPLAELRVDGGMAQSDAFLRIQANVLGVPVVRSGQLEATALGAALLAGLGVHLWSGPQQALELARGHGRRFEPSLEVAERAQRAAAWRKAVDAVVRIAAS